jgi:hypothetical protein
LHAVYEDIDSLIPGLHAKMALEWLFLGIRYFHNIKAVASK